MDVRGGWVGLLAVALCACGEASPDGGEASPVSELPLEPGTCGIVKRIVISGDAPGLAPIQDTRATRQSGGFGFGPWESGSGGERAGALMLDAGGRRHLFEAVRSSNDVHWPLFLAGTSLMVDVHRDTRASTDGNDHFRARALGAETSSDRGPVVDARWRGTDRVIAQPSLDGLHAVFAIWPTALSEPRAAYLGGDGSRSGDAFSLAPPDRRITRCECVTPTEAGGVVTFFDDAEAALHVFEFAPRDDGVRQVVELPSGVRSCPVVALDPVSVSFLAPHGDGAAAFDLYQVMRDGTTNLTEVELKGDPRAFTRTELGILVLERTAEGDVLELLSETGVREFSDSVPSFGQIVPAEPGSIFLDVTTLEGARELVELSCR